MLAVWQKYAGEFIFGALNLIFASKGQPGYSASESLNLLAFPKCGTFDQGLRLK